MIANTISIIGMGLIGSSLARVIKNKNLCKTLVAIDSNAEVCNSVVQLNLADQVSDNIAAGIKDADIIIIAIPVGNYINIAGELRGNLKPGAILTDVGSVKQSVISSLKPYLPENVFFIPGHPIAGTEHSGPEAGFAELFEGRWTVLTPLEDTDVRAIEPVVSLWEACGATVEFMEPKRHDLVMSITSHLPHLIAYTIVGTASELEHHTQEDVIKFSASGFRDFTRIAASDPVMWRDIFLNNKESVLEILQRFNEDLTILQKAIRNGQGDVLEDFFIRTRNIRRQVIEAGQADYVYPTQSQEGTPPAVDRKKASGS
jgi:cyclohexadieny/prephenate dehydrogenase